jgi:AcrR family transcriptional regulator
MSGSKQGVYRTKMRDHMLEIANRIISSEGLAAVQARRIAQEAGCAVGTLYNIYGSLDLLIIEANACTLEALGQHLSKAGATADGSQMRDRLSALALGYLDFASSRDKAWRALFEHQMSPGGEVPLWYRDRQRALFALVEAVLEHSIADPVLRASNARALFAAVHGIVAISLDSKLGDFDYSETERQVKFVVGSVADGVSAGNK